MNTKFIKGIKTNNLPNFPDIMPLKHNRIFTKHFCLLGLWEERSQVAMLTWLVYQSKIDGTVLYSSKLLKAYGATIKAANNEYGNSISKKTPNGLKTFTSSLRFTFSKLIEKGYLWHTKKLNHYLISPVLVYHYRGLSAAEYKTVCRWYNDVRNDYSDGKLLDLSQEVIRIIKSKLE